MKIHVSDNKEIVEVIREALRQNDGYCPCVYESKGKEEYRCPCQRFREEAYIGDTCHCGLYVKDEL